MYSSCRIDASRWFIALGDGGDSYHLGTECMQLGTERGRRIPRLQQSFRYILTELRITVLVLILTLIIKSLHIFAFESLLHGDSEHPSQGLISVWTSLPSLHCSSALSTAVVSLP
jgi:hypothetical protein